MLVFHWVGCATSPLRARAAQEDFGDIGGLEKQIQELIEAVVLPMTQADRFKAVGVDPPKGVLLFGPPGTGKTLMWAPTPLPSRPPPRVRRARDVVHSARGAGPARAPA